MRILTNLHPINNPHAHVHGSIHYTIIIFILCTYMYMYVETTPLAHSMKSGRLPVTLLLTLEATPLAHSFTCKSGRLPVTLLLTLEATPLAHSFTCKSGRLPVTLLLTLATIPLMICVPSSYLSLCLLIRQQQMTITNTMTIINTATTSAPPPAIP